MNRKGAFLVLMLMSMIGSGNVAWSQRCSGALYFRIHDGKSAFNPDSVQKTVFGVSQWTLPQHGMEVLLYDSEGRPLKALAQLAGEDLLWAELSCSHAWRMVIRKQGKKASRFKEMEIRFVNSCDGFFYLDIKFRPGIHRFNLCSGRAQKSEGDPATTHRHGTNVTPASWSLRKRN